MIAAGQIPYQNVPNGQEKQIRFEDLPVTRYVKEMLFKIIIFLRHSRFKLLIGPNT